jgi:ribose-phosphate pyrophosphokinase
MRKTGVDRVVLVDVHSKQVPGFFGLTPADDLDVSGVAAEYFNFKKLHRPVIVSPDHDGVQRAGRFCDLLQQNGTHEEGTFFCCRYSDKVSVVIKQNCPTP